MRILIVAYYFPPLENIATHRLYSFARYFVDQGDNVTVVCPEWNGNLHVDISGITIISTGSMVFDPSYGASLNKTSLISKFKSAISEKVLHRSHLAGSRPSSFFTAYLNLLGSGKLSPLDYDVVVSSYSPLDSHFIAADIKRRNPSIKWVADFRDLYSLLDYQNYGWTRRILQNREKNLIHSADLITTVSKVLADELTKLHGKKAEVIYNGFNSYSFSPDKEFQDFLERLSSPIISYAGSLYHGERDVVPFLNYYKQNELDKRFVLFFSLLDDIDEAYLARNIQNLNISNVIIKRNISYANSQELLKRSHAVLLFANFNFRGNGFLTGKIFEYILARKPIIYSGTTQRGYELYDLILNHRMGDSFSAFNWSDPSRVYDFIDCEKYCRKNQAAQLYKLIHEL